MLPSREQEPPDDALIRFIMRQFAEHIEDARNKHIFYIDFLDARTKSERLKEVSFRIWNGIFRLFISMKTASVILCRSACRWETPESSEYPICIRRWMQRHVSSNRAIWRFQSVL